MKYVFIENHQAKFSIKAMCRVLRIARSGWYAWRLRHHSKVRVSSSASSVMRRSVRPSQKQNSVMVRLVWQMNCRSTTSKPLLPVCVVRG
ncbi:transposase [Klebsiella michiganensis]|nr:transposase [Klebsiella michiganensis]